MESYDSILDQTLILYIQQSISDLSAQDIMYVRMYVLLQYKK